MNSKQELDNLLAKGKASKVSSLYYVNKRESLIVKNAGKITESTIDKYLEGVLPVIEYLDPYLEYDVKEMVSRRLLDTDKQKYSKELRESAFETLLIFKNNSRVFKNCSDGYVERRVERLIEKVLGKNAKEWRFWCTNDEYLPMVALIAPEAYISSIEEIIKDAQLLGNVKNVLLKSRFLDDDWLKNIRYSLKLLALYEKHFAKTIKCLNAISRYEQSEDGGINYCLRTIIDTINPYRPRTLYPSKDIPDVVLGILTRDGKHKRKVLKELLPHKINSFCSYELPEWVPQRELVNKMNTDNNINKDYCVAFKKYTLAFIDSTQSFDEMQEFINELPYLLGSNICEDEDVLGRIKEKLEHYDLRKKFSDRDRGLIWESLVKAKHKMPSKFTMLLDDAIRKNEPNDAISKCLLYLDNGDYELIGRQTRDYEKREKELGAEVLLAVEKVYVEKGLEGIFALSEKAKYPLKLASIIPRTSFRDVMLDEIAETIKRNVNKSKNEFIRSVINADSYYESIPEILSKLKYSSQKDPDRLKILLSIKPGKDVWDIIDGKKTVNYWKKVSINKYHNWSLTEYETCIRGLNSVKRQRDSIGIAATALYRNNNLESNMLFDLLEGLNIAPDHPINASESQDIEEIIRYLQKNSKNVFRLAMLELRYIAVFEKWRRDLYPTNLAKVIGTNPRYFCDVCDRLFGGDGNYQLYRILHDFYIKPGLNDKNKITKMSLKKWIDYVEKYYSGNKERLESIHSIIGQNLPLSKCDLPINEDAILDFLENNKQDDYYNGFLIGVANSRGIIRVDDEHLEEKRLNKIWLDAAKEVEKKGFVNVAGLFRKTAEMFLEDALRMDQGKQKRNAGTI